LDFWNQTEKGECEIIGTGGSSSPDICWLDDTQLESIAISKGMKKCFQLFKEHQGRKTTRQ